MPLFILIFYIITLCIPTAIHAQSLPPTLSVSPSLLQVDLRKEFSEAIVYYTNLSDQPIDILLSTKDFNPLDETGTVHFVEEHNADSYTYSLASWLYFDNQQISLNPGEQKAVTITIDKEKLPVGGHYASLFAEFVQREENDDMIPLKGVVSTLLFVRAGKGFEREEARIRDFRTDGSFFDFPKQFTFRLQNTGNIDITPYGLVEITDFFGRKVAKGIVNDGSLMTLPETIRRYTVKVKKDTLLFPGLYTAKLTINYGEKKLPAVATLTFWSQGSVNLIVIGIVLALLLLLFSGYHVWKKPFKK